jgi:subtilisin family serine protease
LFKDAVSIVEICIPHPQIAPHPLHMKPEKISAYLLLAHDVFETEGAVGIAPRMRSLGLFGRLAEVPKALVFLRTDEEADLSHLQNYGVDLNQDRGRVRTAAIPLRALGAISEDAAVHRVTGARRLKPLLDVARAHVHVPQFRTTSQLSGRGVVVGVVDTGIDPAHPGFAGRILRVWDQTLPGTGVQEGHYGRELTPQQANGVTNDTIGHGTHVTGIAAGVHSQFAGVAPDAEIVMVKSDLQDAHIADGIRYIFRIAGTRPAVVNLSLGGHADAHDGTDPLSELIDQTVGPGRIVCCAAGNEGNDNLHAQSTVAAGIETTVRFAVMGSQGAVGVINGWYSGNSAIHVAIESPSGSVTPFQPVIASANPVGNYRLPEGLVRIVTPPVNPVNGDFNFFLEVTPIATAPGSVLQQTVWKVRLQNAGNSQARVDMWTVNGEETTALFTGTSVQNSMKIGSPGCSASAVTVASFTTRNSWTDSAGNAQRVGLALNDISDFSSNGPLRNGGQKPDVTAPGAMIISARSSAGQSPQGFDVSTDYVANAGTSMATPFISGIAALLLERNPQLDSAGVKALLKQASAIPGVAPNTFDSKWGFGLINATQL